MAHLGRSEYALLFHLSSSGRQPLAVDGNKAMVGDTQFRNAVVNIVVGAGLVSRADDGDGAVELELSADGRTELDAGLAQKWVVDHSGLHEESKTYRFEVPDPVSGRRFVVAVAQETGAELANRVTYGVIGSPSVRDSLREIETIGPEGGFPVKMTIEGAGAITVWRKL